MRSFDPYERCGPACKAVFPPLDDATGREHDDCPPGVVMVARPGEWIIKGVKGEFYPCKPEVFSATYEAVGA